MKAPEYGTTMNNNMSRFGRPRALKMFADWTDRIGKGALPPVPSRPVGVERNVVITEWDLAGDHFVHDHTVTDKRNPTINANGPIYALAQHAGLVVALDPNTGKQTEEKLVALDGKTWSINLNNHTAMMDEKARVWMSTQNPSGFEAPFCNDPALSPYAKLYGRTVKNGRTIGVYDPKTKKSELIPVCYSTHHLNFTHKGNVLYHSGDTEVVGWIDTKVWDTTHDAAKAVGWCPMVLDTNGDGKIEQDRTKWNFVSGGGPGTGEAAAALGDRNATTTAFDPTKDTRISGFLYGMGVSPTDDSFWVAKFQPTVPSGIIRFERGAHPPETCKTEYLRTADGERQIPGIQRARRGCRRQGRCLGGVRHRSDRFVRPLEVQGAEWPDGHRSAMPRRLADLRDPWSQDGRHQCRDRLVLPDLC
jgi:hypothetical protein